MEDLTEEERKPPEFIVEGIIPVGMTFISGAPKIRKSFLALQIAAAVASGASLFGRKTIPCEVAYLDLEGSKSRIAARSGNMATCIPRGVHIANTFPSRLGDKLVEDIRKIHQAHRQIRLFIVDTYSRARGYVKGSSANAYDQDVALLEPAQRMALEENIAIVFIHHDKKGAGFSSDSFERLSGTMGISGSADCVINLVAEGKRFDGKATLEYNPRDARGGEINLEFDEAHREWYEVIKSEPVLMGNPVCAWIVQNVPPPRVEGKFIPYDEIPYSVYGATGDRPGNVVPHVVAQWKSELFSQQGIAVQTGVKSNGRRGIRIINLR